MMKQKVYAKWTEKPGVFHLVCNIAVDDLLSDGATKYRVKRIMRELKERLVYAYINDNLLGASNGFQYWLRIDETIDNCYNVIEAHKEIGKRVQNILSNITEHCDKIWQFVPVVSEMNMYPKYKQTLPYPVQDRT